MGDWRSRDASASATPSAGRPSRGIQNGGNLVGFLEQAVGHVWLRALMGQTPQPTFGLVSFFERDGQLGDERRPRLRPTGRTVVRGCRGRCSLELQQHLQTPDIRSWLTAERDHIVSKPLDPSTKLLWRHAGAKTQGPCLHAELVLKPADGNPNRARISVGRRARDMGEAKFLRRSQSSWPAESANRQSHNPPIPITQSPDRQSPDNHQSSIPNPSMRDVTRTPATSTRRTRSSAR